MSFPDQFEDEEFTKKLLKEESKLRVKQPVSWAKQTYRKNAKMGRKTL